MDALEIFEAFLEEEPDPQSAMDALCARHPAHASAFRELWDGYRRTMRLLDDAGALVREDPRGAASARYEVRGEIARGGMGRVLEVWDTELRRTLAMKVLRDEPATHGVARRARQRSRLLNEAQVLGQLEHPGIVPVHEVGRDARGCPYFTMARVHGRELGEVFEDVRLGRGGWTLARAVGVLLRACEAVAHAHARGVIHRDLKPSNVMVGRFGEVFVMDWGLAKARGREGAADVRLRSVAFSAATAEEDGGEAWPSQSVHTDRRDAAEAEVPSPLLTVEGDVVGTPSYMAPEQASGRIEEVDELCDVYSAGGMLYHLLAGRAPYLGAGQSSTPREVLRAVLDGEPEALERIAPHTPPELASICARAMARDRGARYPSMSALADDLRAYLERRVVQAHGAGPWNELRKWMQRHRAVVALSATLFLVLVGAAAGFGFLYRDASAQRQVAERRLAFLRQNPSGYRIDNSTIPSLSSFTEDFEDGVLDPPLRRWVNAQDADVVDGRLVLRRHGPSGVEVSFGLDDSVALMRGDFDLVLTFESGNLSLQASGQRYIGLNVRRARDGVLAGAVHRGSIRSIGGVALEPPVVGYWALVEGAQVSGREPCHAPRGKLRIARTGNRITAFGWNEGWKKLLDEETTPEAVQFFAYVHAIEGDDGEVSVTIDEVRFVAGDDPAGTALGTVTSFTGERGELFVPIGSAGVGGIIDGRLVVDNFADAVGESWMSLDAPRYALRGDFDVSLRFELLDSIEQNGAAAEFRFELRPPRGEEPLASLVCDPREPTVSAWAEPYGDSASARRPARSRGRLRFARTGTRLSLQSWDDGWHTLRTVTESRDDLGLQLGVRSTSPGTGLTVAIDDLRIDGLYARW